MSYLVDTHVFLWALFTPKKLSTKARKILVDPNLIKYVSSITFWEISLKYQLGKLKLKNIFPDKLPKIAKEDGFEILDIDANTASSFYKLPKFKNKDPFDQMLIWQAIYKDFYLLTKDLLITEYKNYGLKTVW